MPKHVSPTRRKYQAVVLLSIVALAVFLSRSAEWQGPPPYVENMPEDLQLRARSLAASLNLQLPSGGLYLMENFPARGIYIRSSSSVSIITVKDNKITSTTITVNDTIAINKSVLGDNRLFDSVMAHELGHANEPAVMYHASMVSATLFVFSFSAALVCLPLFGVANLRRKMAVCVFVMSIVLLVHAINLPYSIAEYLRESYASYFEARVTGDYRKSIAMATSFVLLLAVSATCVLYIVPHALNINFKGQSDSPNVPQA